MRRWAAASLLVVAALHAGATGQWAISLAVAAVVLGALAFGARLALSPTGTRVAAGLAALAGAALGGIFAPLSGQPLRAPWPSAVLAGILAGAAFLCRRPADRISVAALLPGLLALAACGEGPLGRGYAVFAVAHLALALLALRAGLAPARAGGASPSGRRVAVGAVIVGAAAAVALGFAVALPPLSRWTESRILHALGVAESGFSDRLWLGSLDGMLQSDEVVLRVDGAATDYLRGTVYDHYEIGRWGRQHAGRLVPVATAASSPASSSRARVTAVGGARDRYFLPLGARAVSTADANAAADRYGVLRALAGAAREVSFSVGEGPADFPVADPGDGDLDVPRDLRPALERIAREWTAGATTPDEKVAALVRRLRTDYTYSLRYDHHRRRDPLLDFLLDDHRGHCEYFATALTLLARSAGVPARVAVGYRVAEENPLGHYRVVRERNAHAWSEVFLPGRGFVTMDATPDGAVAANEPHTESWIAAAWDLFRSSWARAVADIGLLHVAGALSLLVVAGLLFRWARGRSGPRERRARQRLAERPPPSLERLLAALDRRGLKRPASEPLERFAARLSEQGMEEAAAVVERWAALRYGGVGDGEALARETEGWVTKLAASPGRAETRR